MFSKPIQNDVPLAEVPHKEGDLYKIIITYGKTFELRYGYYEECDRQNPLCEPVVIYPDFLGEPIYTDDGTPFVTMMQDACRSYRGDAKRTPDTTCAECNYFRRAEDWIGICQCQLRQRKNE
ncbi:MAG: hypothetical protein IKB75_02340 [Clostridia bacterium]|nr:hypothetical protein [Clostridia bacterium]